MSLVIEINGFRGLLFFGFMPSILFASLVLPGLRGWCFVLSWDELATQDTLPSGPFFTHCHWGVFNLELIG